MRVRGASGPSGGRRGSPTRKTLSPEWLLASVLPLMRHQRRLDLQPFLADIYIVMSVATRPLS